MKSWKSRKPHQDREIVEKIEIARKVRVTIGMCRSSSSGRRLWFSLIRLAHDDKSSIMGSTSMFTLTNFRRRLDNSYVPKVKRGSSPRNAKQHPISYKARSDVKAHHTNQPGLPKQQLGQKTAGWSPSFHFLDPTHVGPRPLDSPRRGRSSRCHTRDAPLRSKSRTHQRLDIF